MRFTYFIIAFLFLQQTVFSQGLEEKSAPNIIKSIIFKGATQDQFPIIELGDSIYLEFDDITASEQDYYYKIVHCNYDWQKSNLLKSQYLKGIDNQRITNYENSYTTLQPYSNYQLTIPNNNIRLKVSGNYLLEIYNNNYQLQFSRKFVVYKDLVTVSASVKRSRDFNFINQKQVVQFSINGAGFNIINPKKEVKIAILQNYHWPSAITNVAPQFTLGKLLVYKYDKETSFFGGNEFFNFDTKDLRAPTAAIASIELIDLYNHYLFPNKFRTDKPYTYYPDINGDYVIRTLQGSNSSREAEYTKVHFSIPYKESMALNNVYIYGKHNNYNLTANNQMVYNEENGMMEGTLALKQGFYNYKYVVKKDNNTVDLNIVSGNFHNTENNYTILVYYRVFGDVYDSIIGIGAANSMNISN